jgi:hypothetical protein
VPRRFKAIEIILLSVSGIMLAFFATAHLVVVPAMLDSFREFGLVAPPVTETTYTSAVGAEPRRATPTCNAHDTT